ncbi:hypothetical protein DY000_02051577 [Brassica cretica]|uniref:3-oxoacyl-[acyl-carrier-protein] reductase n=1 Tax=Brassica cretica TaxID=69181 RepID=A0ABQ7F4L5_BRACR|nr:hypothetical protein DY000_02051577 [Brassica cretica]
MLTLLFFSLGLLLLGLLLKFAFADGNNSFNSMVTTFSSVVVMMIDSVELIVLSASCRGLHPDFQEGSEARSHRRQVVWITGANRGIGEALSKQFASLGAKLILSARNDAELFRIKSELKGTTFMQTVPLGKYAPEHVKVLRLDLPSSEERLKKVIEQAVSLFPGDGVDYLIHNAAYEGLYSNAVDASEENLETTFGVNVFGTISLTKLVTPHMLKRGGGHFVVIVHLRRLSVRINIIESLIYTQISSAAGKVPSPGQAIYAASKHALQGYFHSLRPEFYQKGIKVTVVCPGPIETPNGTGTSTSEDKNSPEKLTIIAASHNLKEAWISHQPELLVMYLVQYMPSLGVWLMDKVLYLLYVPSSS